MFFFILPPLAEEKKFLFYHIYSTAITAFLHIFEGPLRFLFSRERDRKRIWSLLSSYQTELSPPPPQTHETLDLHQHLGENRKWCEGEWEEGDNYIRKVFSAGAPASGGKGKWPHTPGSTKLEEKRRPIH
jgi:hypothetical protein